MELMEKRIISIMKSLEDGIRRNREVQKECNERGAYESGRYHEGISQGYYVAYLALETLMKEGDRED